MTRTGRRKPSAAKQQARTAARSALVAELKALADTFELDDEDAVAFLSLLTRYSENNAVLILAQADALGLEVRGVDDVGGYKAFREAGRQVRAGEQRCLYVWARGKSRREEDSSEDELPVTVVEGQTLPAPRRSFFPVGIFHISQTDPIVADADVTS